MDRQGSIEHLLGSVNCEGNKFWVMVLPSIREHISRTWHTFMDSVPSVHWQVALLSLQPNEGSSWIVTLVCCLHSKETLHLCVFIIFHLLLGQQIQIRSQHLSELYCSSKWNSKHSLVNGPKKMPRQLFKRDISRSYSLSLIPSSFKNDLFVNPSGDLIIFFCS